MCCENRILDIDQSKSNQSSYCRLILYSSLNTLNTVWFVYLVHYSTKRTDPLTKFIIYIAVYFGSAVILCG